MNDNNQVGIIAAQYLKEPLAKEPVSPQLETAQLCPAFPHLSVRPAGPLFREMAPAGE